MLLFLTLHTYNTKSNRTTVCHVYFLILPASPEWKCRAVWSFAQDDKQRHRRPVQSRDPDPYYARVGRRYQYYGRISHANGFSDSFTWSIRFSLKSRKSFRSWHQPISIMEGYRMDRTLLTSKDMQMILAGLRSLDSVTRSLNLYGMNTARATLFP